MVKIRVPSYKAIVIEYYATHNWDGSSKAIQLRLFQKDHSKIYFRVQLFTMLSISQRARFQYGLKKWTNTTCMFFPSTINIFDSSKKDKYFLIQIIACLQSVCASKSFAHKCCHVWILEPINNAWNDFVILNTYWRKKKEESS